MSVFSKGFGVSLAAVLAASVASAATITYSTPSDFSSIPITSTRRFSSSFGPGSGPADLGGGEALPFRQFDPAYGTLTGVSISITGMIGTNNDPTSSSFGQGSFFSVHNTSGSSQDYDETFTLHMYLMDRISACMSDVETNGTDETAAGCLLGSLDLNFNNQETLADGATATHSLANSGPLNAISGFGGTVTELSRFVGTGNFPLQIFLESFNQVTNNSGTSQGSVTAFAGATASITYTYDAAPSAETPEPASMFLMGGALLGLGLLRKRLDR